MLLVTNIFIKNEVSLIIILHLFLQISFIHFHLRLSKCDYCFTLIFFM